MKENLFTNTLKVIGVYYIIYAILMWTLGLLSINDECTFLSLAFGVGGVSLYIIARSLKLYDMPQKFKLSHLLISYVCLFLLIGYIGYAHWSMIYSRNSIFMIIISIIMLLVFLKIEMHYSLVNNIAKSMLAVYLIQEGLLGIVLYK